MRLLLIIVDHTLGYKIAASSVLLGVRAIEKHYTYDKGLKKSADHWLSINSQELNKLREDVDLLISASGNGKKRVLKCEHLTRKLARRSLVTTRFIQKGEKILVIDDLIATGGTAEAAAKLIEISGGKVAGFIFVINLFDLGGSDNLIKKNYKVENLIDFPGH